MWRSNLGCSLARSTWIGIRRIWSLYNFTPQFQLLYLYEYARFRQCCSLRLGHGWTELSSHQLIRDPPDDLVALDHLDAHAPLFGLVRQLLNEVVPTPRIRSVAQQSGGSAVRRTEDTRDLDWGVLVPYHFIGGGLPIVSLSISGLDYRRHHAWGQAVSRAARSLGRKIVFVASGDLSHKLTQSSPYGFAPAGEAFENEVVAILNSRKLSELADIEPGLVAEAAECGLRSFISLSGVLDGLEFHGGTLAHEGPFGVGYAVALFETSEESYV